MNKFILLAAAGSVALASQGDAATTIAGSFTRTSDAEMLTAPFTSVSVGTARSYTGLVEVQVAGTGNSFASWVNDAFYDVASQTANSSFYHLGLGTTSEPLVGGNPNRSIRRFITFIEGVGAVSAGTLPAYRADHRYHFVVDLGAQQGQLGFGVLDGNFADNGGAYELTLYSLAGGGGSAVPEPASWALMIAGFGIVGAASRHRGRVVLN